MSSHETVMTVAGCLGSASLVFHIHADPADPDSTCTELTALLDPDEVLALRDQLTTILAEPVAAPTPVSNPPLVGVRIDPDTGFYCVSCSQHGVLPVRYRDPLKASIRAQVHRTAHAITSQETSL
jgi:hypothetical protein